MQRFVFFTGIYNVLLGTIFYIPFLPEFLGVNAPPSLFWMLLPATLAMGLGAMLIYCSRDLANRAPVVLAEGILRLSVGVLFVFYGFFGDIGLIAGVVGIIDIVIGIVYLVGIPRALGQPLMVMLQDGA